MASLPDLPNDALLHLLSPEFLSARDVAALACTCRMLRSCARQVEPRAGRCAAVTTGSGVPLPRCCEFQAPMPPFQPPCSSTLHCFVASQQGAVWQTHCEAWLAQRAGQAGAGTAPSPARSPDALLAALRLPTHRALYTALHALGSWPEGLFYATSEAAQPRGDLQLGRLDAEGGCLQLFGVRPRIVEGPPARTEDAWRLSPSLSIVAAPSNDGSQVCLSAAKAHPGRAFVYP